MKNKVLILLMSMLMMFSFSGCTEQTSESASEDLMQVNHEKEDTQEQEKVKIQGEKVMQEVKMYYSDDQAENLVEKQMEIEVKSDQSLEEKVVEGLKNKPTDSNLHSVLDESIMINSVKVEEQKGVKIALVDLSSKGLSGSSTQEYFLKDATILALTDLDSVDKVQFLVDGEVVETLMGHIEVSEPFDRSDAETNIIKE